jgi:hypothetical protein
MTLVALSASSSLSSWSFGGSTGLRLAKMAWVSLKKSAKIWKLDKVVKA